MVNAQEWLDKNYPLAERENIRKLDIYGKELTGTLNLADFINLEELNCSYNQLTNLDLTECVKLELLECYSNKLTNLDLNNLTQLEIINCSNNYLHNFDYSSSLNPEKLESLNISDNNLPEQDLSVFNKLTNLETLWIGGGNKENLTKDIYNKFHGSLESLKNLVKLKNLHIANTDIDSGWEYLPNSIEKISSSSEEIPESKVKEISEQLKWIGKDFSGQQLREWIDFGFNPKDYGFALFLTRKGYQPQPTTNYAELREEYSKGQDWLDQNYPKGERSEIAEIYLTEPSLEGELDLSDFTCEDDIKVYISLVVDDSKLVIKNKPKRTKIIKLISAQEYINQQYPTKESREKVTKLEFNNGENKYNLEGNLDLADFVNLKKLDFSYNKLISLNLSNCEQLESVSCWNNLLTNLTLPTNLINLEYLGLNDNNFSSQDLSFLVDAINLNYLLLGSADSRQIIKNYYNRFINSLSYLSNMQQLKTLDINNTDINEVDVTKLPTSLEYICYSTKQRPDCQLTAIVPKLDEWTWADIHSDFTLKQRKGWEKSGFTKEQTKEWIELGIKPEDYNFVSYLKEVKKLTSEWVLNNKDTIDYQESRRKCNEFDWCRQCQQSNTSQKWCQSCAEQEWQQDLKQLTGQELVEKFIEKQPTSIYDDDLEEKLKWIPYEQFTDIEYLTDGGFSKIYKAKWQGQESWEWKDEEKKEELNYTKVALKILTNSQNITLDFLTEMVNSKLVSRDRNYGSIVSCYGISQDPSTKNYLMVMEYESEGNLRDYLKKQASKLSWQDKINKLNSIACGLKKIHDQGLVHRDFHSGNILNSKDIYCGYDECFIADLGLSKPVNSQSEESKIFGVLPYVAPEVLQGSPYAQASDIYSFGIIAYEICSALPPYYNIPHDNLLATQICQGLRPQFQIKIPQLLEDLINRCWDANPKKRSSAEKLRDTLYWWYDEIKNKKDTKFTQQIQAVETHNQTLPEEIRFPEYELHKGAVYHSKAINTKQITQLLQTVAISTVNASTIDLDLSGLIISDLETEQITQIEIPPKGND